MGFAMVIRYLKESFLGVGPKKMTFLVVFPTKGSAGPPSPPPLVILWAIQILGPYFNVAVDAIGPETDFTLETDGKMCTKNKWTFLQNPKFHL